MPLSGTKDFLDFLSSQQFLPAESLIKELKGKEVTEDYFIKNNFRKPILIPKKKGLRLLVPDSNFKINDVCSYLGTDYYLDVIDVIQQDQFKMKFGDFISYFEERVPRSRILNVLSLEISRTNMASLVEPPYVIKEMSIVEKLWRGDGSSDDFTKPSVQKYCLMSMTDSWTDFHIDFGGSSVWYHVLWGRKIFYLIPPRKRYIKEFMHWMNESNNRMIFFPDLLRKFSADNACSEVYKLEIVTGDTIMLPAGWIHAVHTAEDSLVFGGNFLHSLSIPTQLKIYNIECILKTETRFMFPYFEKLHWFVAEYVLQKLEGNLTHNIPPVKMILKGALKLLETLPEWRKRFQICSKDERDYNFPGPEDMQMSKSVLILRLHKVVSSLLNVPVVHAITDDRFQSMPNISEALSGSQVSSTTTAQSTTTTSAAPATSSGHGSIIHAASSPQHSAQSISTSSLPLPTSASTTSTKVQSISPHEAGLKRKPTSALVNSQETPKKTRGPQLADQLFP